jgi:hypothetical protein
VRDKGGVGRDVFHPLSFIIDHMVQFLQAADVIFFGSNHGEPLLSFGMME